MIRYIFKERLFGLDFTMRDKSLLKKTNGTMHGYSITPEEHIREILAHLDFTKCSAFLDIGCGKGLVLKIVSGGSFQSLGGIEYDERLAGICKRNLRRLGLKDIQIFCGDAREFDGYERYNTFFLLTRLVRKYSKRFWRRFRLGEPPLFIIIRHVIS